MDAIVIGAGFAGVVISEQLSSKYQKRVLLVEERQHIGGNMYDEIDSNGFLIQKYGPHIIYTNSSRVISYLSSFSELIPHDCVMVSNIDGKFIQLPFSFKSIQQFYDVEKASEIISAIRSEYDCSSRISVFNLINNSNKIISKFGKDLYSKAFENYICKQWGIGSGKISKDVINRCSFSPSYTNRYLDRDFQYLPAKGFSKMMNQMIHNDNVTIKTNFDALKHLQIIENQTYWDGKEISCPIIYTGSIDELFDFKYGVLPYRSLKFVTRYYNCERKLPCEIVSMPQDLRLIRKTEYKYFSPVFSKKNIAKTIVVSEMPYQYDFKKDSIRCYPIINDDNINIYKAYLSEANQIPNLYLVGRLAEYKYYNMDDVILHSLDISKKIALDNDFSERVL
jgi:UDP-galactopyranose mutase